MQIKTKALCSTMTENAHGSEKMGTKIGEKNLSILNLNILNLGKLDRKNKMD